jgi:hypothetical protein
MWMKLYEYFDFRNIRPVSLILKKSELSRGVEIRVKETVNLAEDL